MKRLLAFLFSLTLLLVAGFKADAQQSLRSLTSNFGEAYDTIVDAGTAFLDIHNTGAKTATTFVVHIDKLTGTIGGAADVKVQISTDGTNWTTLNQPGLQTAVVPLDVADADGWYNIVLDNNPGNYYRLLATGAGTATWRFRAWCLSR